MGWIFLIFYYVGLAMFTLGVVYALFPSKKTYFKYGYRTPRARETEKTFIYAQKQARNMLLLMGGVTFCIGFLLKTMYWTHLFLLEFFFILFPIALFFYLVERKIEQFNDQLIIEQEDIKNEITND